MTEIASPSPDPTHANSAATNGENGQCNRDASTPLSDIDDIEERIRTPSKNTSGGDDNALQSSPRQSRSESRQLQSPNSAKRDAAKTGINGTSTSHTREQETAEDGPPAKRRRVRETTPHNPIRKPKVESPPWKKVEAEGPSTFVAEDGRRKSGRINLIPLELQSGDKRITRRAINGTQSSPPRNRNASQANSQSPVRNSNHATAKRAPVSAGKHTPAKTAPSKPPSRKPPPPEPKTSTRTRRRSPSPPPKHSLGTRRSTRHARDTTEHAEPTSPGGVRIKLKVKPTLTTIPLVHRDQANVRPKLGPTFEEYFERAVDIPVEQGGLQVAEDGPKYTDDMARQDAEVILRIEKEVEEGGLLAPDRCYVFEPEAVEEPPRQWAHMDHLTKAMTNFRKLMYQEQQRHISIARRLAYACEAEWRRRNPQPKTAEEIEQEEIEKTKARLRQVTKAMVGTWENVKTEVNRRRLLEWEAEEQRRVKAALNQAVNLSEQKLQARQARLDTEDLSEEDSEGLDDDLSSDMGDIEDTDSDDEDAEEGLGAGSEEGESNMSSSDDDDDKHSVLSDEGLTQEELRAKYANLPDVTEKKDQGDGDAKVDNQADGGDGPDGVPDDDTSDESVDMDDSSEEDSDDDGSAVSEEGSEESDEEPAGLLGLFFGKSELKKLQKESDGQEAETKEDEDVEMTNAEPATEPSAEAKTVAEENTNGDRPAGPGTTLPETNGVPAVASEDIVLVNGTHANGDTPPNDQDVQAPKTDSMATSGDILIAPPHKSPLAVKTSPVDVQQETQPPTPLEVENGSDDISMVDAPAITEASQNDVPGVEIEAPSSPHRPSPDTDAITNLHSPSGSQSPRTSDTKPSDVETPTSASLLNAPKTDSRSASPGPAAPRTEIPFLLRGTLREYQHHGLDWLATLYANNTNGILADEMGLGKTIQTIALLAHLACHHEVWGPHLVIVPTSVMLNWEMEFKKWCPGFKILTYYGNQEERKRKRQGWTNDDVWNVCITSYQMVLQDQQVFRRRRWHYMILDEAHNIKNFKSQRWQTLLGFNTHSRLLITGTPLQNNLTELWSLLYFLAPPENGEGGFVDLKEFHNWFARPESQILENGREQLDDEARAIIAKLHKVLRPYLLRRLKADVEKQMPAKYEHVEFCRLSKRQRELYDGFLSRADTRQTLSSGNYMSIINCLMQLRKVCNHPDLFVDRPIMTSFRMRRSVPADFESKEQVVRRLLAEKPMSTVSLEFLNMIPTKYEGMSRAHTDRIAQLSSHRILLDLREAQKVRANNAYTALDPATVKSNIVYLESAARWGRFEELQHCVYLNALRRQQRPIYGKGLVELLTLDTHRRPYKQKPKVPQKIMSWFEEDSFLLHNAIPTIQQRAGSMEMTITKFACVTPAVVTGDMNKFFLGAKGIEAFEDTDLVLSAPVKYAPYMPKEPPLDPWHEARMRLTIQFPDKRLLQYDCGKLQALDKLLRKLQAGGHRALIFTQMTKVLDILEQFLNIHGHKYLRLDGATKVEQRQILTDRFNHDPRILCFILSTRSGGLGINLTGADTVIFYDQDWNPAMDKQCQDRCHRIGQTRDVHIYRLVSEHTIEANILRKASQKQMLDDVVIQEGEFTTDYFNKLSVRDVIGNNGEIIANENDLAANLAMDRVLGGVESTNPRNVGRVLEQAEDTEDVAAARVAEKEIQQDDADFLEQQPTSGGASGASSVRQGTPRDGESTPGPLGKSGLGIFAESAGDDAAAVVEEAEVEYNAFGERIQTIDDYMLKFMAAALEGTPLDLPKDKKKSKKKGKDTRKR